MNRSPTRFSKNFESKCSFPSNSIRSMINFCPCMRSVEPLEWGSKRERLHGKLISWNCIGILVPFLHRLWNFLGLIISVIIILWSFPRKFPEINIWLLFYATGIIKGKEGFSPFLQIISFYWAKNNRDRSVRVKWAKNSRSGEGLKYRD